METVETAVEVVYGNFARLDVPTARVIRTDTGERVASCHHQHMSADGAYECGRRMQRRWLQRQEANK